MPAQGHGTRTCALIFLFLSWATGSAIKAHASNHSLLRRGRKLGSALPTAIAGEDTDVCANRPARNVVYAGVKLPNLLIEAVFRSRRARLPTDVTLVTQLSADRLHMLEAQCAAWGGVTSAAVYLPILFGNGTVSVNAEDIPAAKDAIRALHARMDASGGCRLDVVLVSENLRTSFTWAYPYNSVRNFALARARTEVVLLLDVDFLVTSGLHTRLSEASAAAGLADDTGVHRQALVLPAFETGPDLGVSAGRAAAANAVACSKAELLQMFRNRTVIQFAEFYMPGHKQSHYRRWFTADSPYRIRYKQGYEPYLLVSRRQMPWYDERFRGYGFDKVMHIWHLEAMGFQFVGHPSAWVVHRPHAPSAGYNRTFTGAAYSKLHKGTDHLSRMERLAMKMMAEIKSGVYPPQGVTALAACREVPTYPQRRDKWW